jgi:hypothetical protein
MILVSIRAEGPDPTPSTSGMCPTLDTANPCAVNVLPTLLTWTNVCGACPEVTGQGCRLTLAASTAANGLVQGNRSWTNTDDSSRSRSP